MAAVETTRTEVRAEARYVRTAPRKAQLVAEQIRGRPVPEARTILAFLTRDAARDVEKVLASAVANAEANHGLVGDDLYVSAAFVGAGPTLKRWRARARGRVARIKKRTCHITVRLAPVETDGRATPRPAPAEEAKPKRAPRRQAADQPAESTTKERKAEKPKAEKPKADKPKRARGEKKDSGEAPKTKRRRKSEED